MSAMYRNDENQRTRLFDKKLALASESNDSNDFHGIEL